ncbi:unnamed protein product [Paramecium sonneborni]|uniref:Uncharacterized protein n=1 Tax=Paramecium sonneborni TaxID=65129 RepID=A0A8S1RS93_9CILI|nr:unnamed protein product [Paramecium sonneborni]
MQKLIRLKQIGIINQINFKSSFKLSISELDQFPNWFVKIHSLFQHNLKTKRNNQNKSNCILVFHKIRQKLKLLIKFNLIMNNLNIDIQSLKFKIMKVIKRMKIKNQTVFDIRYFPQFKIIEFKDINFTNQEIQINNCNYWNIEFIK